MEVLSFRSLTSPILHTPVHGNFGLVRLSHLSPLRETHNHVEPFVMDLLQPIQAVNRLVLSTCCLKSNPAESRRAPPVIWIGFPRSPREAWIPWAGGPAQGDREVAIFNFKMASGPNGNKIKITNTNEAPQLLPALFPSSLPSTTPEDSGGSEVWWSPWAHSKSLRFCLKICLQTVKMY